MQHSSQTTKQLPAKKFAADLQRDDYMEIPPETDIQFTNDPVIKDFLNLSSGGTRANKTQQQKIRQQMHQAGYNQNYVLNQGNPQHRIA